MLVWKQPQEVYLTVIATQLSEWQYPPAQTLKTNKQQKQSAHSVNLAKTLPFIKAALCHLRTSFISVAYIWNMNGGIRFYDLILINKKSLIPPDNQYVTNHFYGGILCAFCSLLDSLMFSLYGKEQRGHTNKPNKKNHRGQLEGE